MTGTIRAQLHHALLLVCLAAPLACGSTALAGNTNAALYYWRAFWHLNADKDRIDAILDLTLEGDLWTPDEEATAALRSLDYVIDSLLLGSSMPECDFALDYELGFDMLLPHLAPMRRAARLLEFDARRAFVSGDVDAAAERIGAIFRMAQHISVEGTLISSLVSVAIFALGHDALRRYDDIGAFDNVSRETLREALGTFDATDPFGIRGALHRERHMVTSSLRRLAQAPDAADQIARLLGHGSASSVEHLEPELRRLIDRLRRNDEINGHIDLLDTYYLHVTAAWDRLDAGEALKRLDQRLEQGAYGPFAKFFVPAITRMHANSRRAEEDLYRDAIRRVGG